MNTITVSALIASNIDQVWECWTQALHVMHWNFASTDWHCPEATNDLVPGGEFHYIMAAKDDSMRFDFWGTYQNIEAKKLIATRLGDGRNVTVSFESTENGVLLTETFEPESTNPEEMQKMGWQMILNNFKAYVEMKVNVE